MIDDIRRKRNRDFIPPVPKASTPSPAADLTPPQTPVVPADLENQILSSNKLERVRQLDFQAQETEEGVPLD